MSYSDGEGGQAGVGVSIFSSLAPRPRAAFATVPDVIRRLWARRAGTGVYHDIFLVEAIGPLLLLCTYPEILRGSAWVHYIDNTAAQHALVRGSSSISSGDHVVGATLEAAAKLDCWPYFDRVHTKSNLVDGLSRGDLNGVWDIVPLVFPGAELSKAFRRAQRFATMGRYRVGEPSTRFLASVRPYCSQDSLWLHRAYRLWERNSKTTIIKSSSKSALLF